MTATGREVAAQFLEAVGDVGGLCDLANGSPAVEEVGRPQDS